MWNDLNIHIFSNIISCWQHLILGFSAVFLNVLCLFWRYFVSSTIHSWLINQIFCQTGANSGAESAYPFGAPAFIISFLWCSCCLIFSFLCSVLANYVYLFAIFIPAIVLSVLSFCYFYFGHCIVCSIFLLFLFWPLYSLFYLFVFFILAIVLSVLSFCYIYFGHCIVCSIFLLFLFWPFYCLFYLFVIFILAIVLSVLWFWYYGDPFGIFKLSHKKYEQSIRH